MEMSQFQVFEPENEVKAFIYQQVQDLEALIQGVGSLAVLVEKEMRVGQPNGEKYAVTFVVAPESLNLQIRSESRDIFEATRIAKEAVRSKLNSFLNAHAEWDRQVEGGIYKGYLH